MKVSQLSGTSSDLGADHAITLAINTDYDTVGCFIFHYREDGIPCSQRIFFDVPELGDHWQDYPRWNVESWEPLTISPAVECPDCGDRGFLRDGKWVAA